MNRQVSSMSSFQLSELKERFGNIKEFMLRLSPGYQLTIGGSEEECYFGDYPTLAEVNRIYSSKAAQAWLIPQLVNLSEFCGAKEKLSKMQQCECAELIVQEFYFLKVSELMLFFVKFKKGYYGQFYGAVDPMVIMSALRRFVIDRNIAYESKEKEDGRKQNAKEKENAITWEEYCTLKNIKRNNPIDEIKKGLANEQE